jgi:glucosamine kinase
VLRASDGRGNWSGLVNSLFKKFDSNAHAIVQFAEEASPRDFGALAPQVVHFASEGDAVGVELMRLGAGHIDDIAARLNSFGIERIAIVGGLAGHMQSWLAKATKTLLVAPAGDAMQGALHLARQAAHPRARHDETAA